MKSLPIEEWLTYNNHAKEQVEKWLLLHRTRKLVPVVIKTFHPNHSVELVYLGADELDAYEAADFDDVDAERRFLWEIHFPPLHSCTYYRLETVEDVYMYLCLETPDVCGVIKNALKDYIDIDKISNDWKEVSKNMEAKNLTRAKNLIGTHNQPPMSEILQALLVAAIVRAAPDRFKEGEVTAAEAAFDKLGPPVLEYFGIEVEEEVPEMDEERGL